jgi:hypothetical protein
VAAFCLDTMIQTQTEGQKNLEDLLRLMMTRYGPTGKQWSRDDLIRDVSEVAGTDLSGFFTHYIASRKRLPLKQCFADAGFDVVLADYGGEAFIFPQTNASRSARAIYEQLTTQHKPAARWVALKIPAPFRQKTVFATQSHASFCGKNSGGGKESVEVFLRRASA